MWIPCMVILGEVCVAVDDAPRAATLYEKLAPYAPRAVVGAGVACWGSLDRFLGMLAIARRDWPAAARHLEEALRLNARMGARPWVGWTHYELARLMHLRQADGDRERAHTHLVRAREAAEALGMARLANRSAQLAADIR
jgi:hypothetical protein